MREKKPIKTRKEQRMDKLTIEKRSRVSEWYQPTVADVYTALCVAKTLLDRIPNAELAIAKRQMNTLEDTLWQFATAR